jgi:hypothetical protein
MQKPPRRVRGIEVPVVKTRLQTSFETNDMKTISVYFVAILFGIVMTEMLRVLSKFSLVSMQGDLATGISFWGTTIALFGMSAVGFAWSIRWIYRQRKSNTRMRPPLSY